MTTDPQEKKKIENEQEAWRTVNAIFAETKKKLLKVIEEKDKALEEPKKQIEELKKINQEK